MGYSHISSSHYHHRRHHAQKRCEPSKRMNHRENRSQSRDQDKHMRRKRFEDDSFDKRQSMNKRSCHSRSSYDDLRSNHDSKSRRRDYSHERDRWEHDRVRMSKQRDRSLKSDRDPRRRTHSPTHENRHSRKTYHSSRDLSQDTNKQSGIKKNNFSHSHKYNDNKRQFLKSNFSSSLALSPKHDQVISSDQECTKNKIKSTELLEPDNLSKGFSLQMSTVEQCCEKNFKSHDIIGSPIEFDNVAHNYKDIQNKNLSQPDKTTSLRLTELYNELLNGDTISQDINQKPVYDCQSQQHSNEVALISTFEASQSLDPHLEPSQTAEVKPEREMKLDSFSNKIEQSNNIEKQLDLFKNDLDHISGFPSFLSISLESNENKLLSHSQFMSQITSHNEISENIKKCLYNLFYQNTKWMDYNYKIAATDMELNRMHSDFSNCFPDSEVATGSKSIFDELLRTSTTFETNC